ALNASDVTELYTSNGGTSDTQAPTAPTGLQVTGHTSSTVSLSWTASTDNVGVTNYDVYRGTTLAGTVGGSVTSFTDTGLSASTTYTYTVKARDAANNTSAASSAVNGTTDSNTWTYCADEGGTCTVTGTKTVRYGAGTNYVTKTVTGSIACTNAAFGS